MAPEPKAHRSPRRLPKIAAPPILECGVAGHQKEIAQVAYRIWLERANRPRCPEDDWLKAEVEVRAKYAG